MRVVRLVLLGLLAYLVTMVVLVFLYPAAPLIEPLKPKIKPVELTGVTGKLYSGKVSNAKYADDLLPLEFQDVTWKLAPAALLKGGAGADVTFAGYGGGGEAQVRRQWNGDINVSDVDFNVESKQLEVLLPAPVTEFSGKITGNFDKVAIVNQLLETISGQLIWNNAIVTTRIYGPEIKVGLGQFDINIEPQDDATHRITLLSKGGDLAIDGNVVLATNGDYNTNLLLSPAANASQELLQVLQRFTRPDGGGRYRVQHNGNINQGT